MSRALVRMNPNDSKNASRTRNAGPRPCVECALTTSWTMSPAIGIGYRREPRRERRVCSARLPAARVVAAGAAGVAAAGPLHHPAALLAGRAEVEPLELRRDHWRGVRERGGRGLRLRRTGLAGRRPVPGAVWGLLLPHPRPDAATARPRGPRRLHAAAPP